MGLSFSSIAKIAAVVLISIVFTNTNLVARSDLIVSGLRAAGDNERTRFVADLSEVSDFRLFQLANPYRVVIDLPQVRFELPDKLKFPQKGMIKRWRYGLFAPGKTRIVLDLDAAVRVVDKFILEPGDDQPARLVVDLERVTPAMVKQIIARQILGAAPSSLNSGDVEEPKPVKKKMSLNFDQRRVVVLDPGHGGLDSGAVGRNGGKEKRIVLAFSKILAEKLEASNRYSVLLTRDDDRFIALADRVSFARDNEAELFISIHADSLSQRSVRGATVYTLSEKASDRLAATIARQENRSDVLAGLEIVDESPEVTDILLDLTRRETKNFSVYFARSLVKNLGPAVTLIRNPHRSAGFKVLKAPDVPSVLFEMGYMSNSEDEQQMRSRPWQEKLAGRMVAVIDDFFQKRPK